MRHRVFSIRHQLLLLGALAVASIWSGALIQYLHLREQSQRLDAVRADIGAASTLAQVARDLARERGLGNGWQAQAEGADRAPLLAARRAVDAGVGTLAVPAAAPVATLATTLAAELADQRRHVDQRDVPAPEAFAAYTALVASAQDAAAAKLRRGMVDMGLPYEHVNHLVRASELLAQVRGLTQGVLRSGRLDAASEDALRWPLLLHRDALHQYALSVPDAARAAQAAALSAPELADAAWRVERMLQSHDSAAVQLDAAAWWRLASTAVDGLSAVAQAEMRSLAAQADAKIDTLVWQMRLTVLVLGVLGVVTLGLVLATVGRIVRGLGQLLGGLDAVATGRDFEAHINSQRPDEFGTISGEVNKLIKIASSVLREQAALTLVDPLTAVMNRRGFDQQLAARGRPDRPHAVPTCVLMIDADHFKSVNDTLGHAAGDVVLQGIANILRSQLRPGDVLARYGGEEFVALLPDCRSGDAVRLGDLLRSAIGNHDFGIGRRVTVSIGAAEWLPGQSGSDAVAVADANLYLAKAGGRDRVHFAAAALLAA